VSNVSQQGQTGGRPPSAVINTNNPPGASVSQGSIAATASNQTVLPGAPLVLLAFTGIHAALAFADGSQPNGTPLGLALEGATGGEGVTYQYNGIVELSAAEWEAVGASSTGLVPGDTYYVSETVAGQIQNAISSTGGHFIVQLGFAISPTELQLSIQYPQPG
jgi:hypothetical protein